MQLEFDVEGFLNALGPRAEVAKFCGVSRTAPYGWMRRGYLSSVTMAKLVEYGKQRRLGLDINKFFIRREDGNGRG
jgi:predicted site-specific integrase-resolvase